MKIEKSKVIKLKQKESNNEDINVNNINDNNILMAQLSDLEKELSNQKIKNEELQKDILVLNNEKQDLLLKMNQV